MALANLCSKAVQVADYIEGFFFSFHMSQQRLPDDYVSIGDGRWYSWCCTKLGERHSPWYLGCEVLASLHAMGSLLLPSIETQILPEPPPLHVSGFNL